MERQKSLKEQMIEISWRSWCELLGAEEGALSYMASHVTLSFIHVHFKISALCAHLRVGGEAGLSSKYVKSNLGVRERVLQSAHIVCSLAHLCLSQETHRHSTESSPSFLTGLQTKTTDRAREGESSRGGIARSHRS